MFSLRKPQVATGVVCLLLAGITLAAFWQVQENGFISLDDPQYILGNGHVRSGLSWAGVAWAFTSAYASNWHPVTWLSHMLDCQWFGLNPTGHHLVNLLFHCANSILLLVLLRRMTGSLWRSAVVAALFAWHPLHVESVAWASERKDVLSALFWLLTMLAYLDYVRRPGRAGYAAVVISFALGLLCKPMVVTLPFVLLLVDFWPLRRVRLPGRHENVDRHGDTDVVPVEWRTLVLEKAPLFALSFVASVVTYFAQKTGGAVIAMTDLPFATRVGNALVAYVRYIAHAFFPVDLAVFYPYTRHLPIEWIMGAAILLVLVTAAFIVLSRSEPSLAVGWFWFIGTLVPTIGLVQAGSQSMADRYMYLPGIGLALAVVWGTASLFERVPGRKVLLPAVSVGALAACFLLTREQVTGWRNSETLFRHATEATVGNYMAYDSLGSALDQAGRFEEAFVCYEEAARLSPSFLEGRYDFGTALMQHGSLDRAVSEFQAALRIDPTFSPAHVNLGKALLDLGQAQRAAEHFLEALRLSPNDPEVHFNLGTSLMALGNPVKATDCFDAALQLKPDYIEAENNLAVSLVRSGRPELAVPHFAHVAQARPGQPTAHLNLGQACLESGGFEQAAAEFRTVLALGGEAATPHYYLAVALHRLGHYEDAALHARRALSLAVAANDEALASKARELLAARPSEMAGSQAP